MMRVSFQMSGGIAFFPGLAAPRTIDVDALPDPTRRELTSLIENSRFLLLARQLYLQGQPTARRIASRSRTARGGTRSSCPIP